MKCTICDSNLTGNQTKFCSNKCKQKNTYKSSNTYIYQTLRYLERKYQLIHEKGGGCERCGYSKNIAVLEFHHKNERTKDFPIDARHLSNFSWEKLQEEAKKCEVLCANCHREHHNAQLELENIHLEVERLRNELQSKIDSLSAKEKLIKKCRHCLVEFTGTCGQVFCSESCRESSKGYPTKESIEQELKLNNNNKTKTGRKFGISPKVIRRILAS